MKKSAYNELPKNRIMYPWFVNSKEVYEKTKEQLSTYFEQFECGVEYRIKVTDKMVKEVMELSKLDA